MYKCISKSGNAAYFNVPDATRRPRRRRGHRPPRPRRARRPCPRRRASRRSTRARRSRATTCAAACCRTSSASEEKLLAEAKVALGDGTPAPLPEERSSAQKYADRVGRLRQAVQLHERNVDALKRELAAR
jgi:hypothetical protein